MKDGPHLGPVLRAVAPGDVQALQDLFAEQAARLDVVRQHRLWQWFGGMPRGFSSGKEVLWGFGLQIAGYLCVFAALIVAGWTRGPVLWVLLLLPVLCALLRVVLVWPPRRRTLRLYENAEQRPAVVVAHDPAALEGPSEAAYAVAALVPKRRIAAGELPALLDAGERLRAWVEERVAPPADAVAFVASIRRGIAAKDHDDSRVPVPAALGDHELARVWITPAVLPGEQLASRLLFLFLHPTDRSRGHTRQVESSLWGGGVEALCAALPLEVAR